jgi:hypothetical protein
MTLAPSLKHHSLTLSQTPSRPERRQPVRGAIAQAKFDHLRRRLFRALFASSLVRIEDPDERKAEAVIFWEATETLARMMHERLAEARS